MITTLAYERGAVSSTQGHNQGCINGAHAVAFSRLRCYNEILRVGPYPCVGLLKPTLRDGISLTRKEKCSG